MVALQGGTVEGSIASLEQPNPGFLAALQTPGQDHSE